ncbi:MAG TPA: bacillithiol biosynthesis deacetylase BshB1 [Bacillaceae bacterium]
MNSTIDILAFGAHADDVEIGMGGAIAKFAASGKRIVICDLTEAELSSNGTVKTRREEAASSARVLGVSERVNLQMPDRGLFLREEYIERIVSVIRKYKPLLIFAPYWEDRHPDHGSCSKLVQEAFFSAGIRNYVSLDGSQPHKAKNLYYYMINGYAKPDFVVDVSSYYHVKMESLKAYETQFRLMGDGVGTPLTDGYLEYIEARERLFGKDSGVGLAEGFMTQRPLIVQNDLFGDPS